MATPTPAATIDISWDSLSSEITESCIQFLTSAFSSTPRPNFLGEINVAAFSFGDTAPECEILEIRDVYKEFLRDDERELELQEEEEEEMVPSRRPRAGHAGQGRSHERGRSEQLHTAQRQQQQQQHPNGNGNGNGNANGFGRSSSVSSIQPLPSEAILPHQRSFFPHHPSQTQYPQRPAHLLPQPSSSMFSPGLGNSFRQSSPYPTGPNSYHRQSSGGTEDQSGSQGIPRPRPRPGRPRSLYEEDYFGDGAELRSSSLPSLPSQSSSFDNPVPISSDQSSSSSSPSLQVHLRVTYSGNLSLSLATSLLINYPAPSFMSLPLSLSLTSLEFRGVFLIAYEGDRRRIHISLVVDDEDEDPFPFSFSGGAGGGGGFVSSSGTGLGRRGVTDGMRLIKSAVVESEVGQGDKHVLKNVGKVEKFVLDVVRKSLESELVFP